MAAVDITMLIGALAILSILAYVFVLRRMKTKPPNHADIAVHTELKKEEVKADSSKTPELEQPRKLPQEKSRSKCRHRFGYLSSLPKESEPPKECLQCGKRVRCTNRRRARKARDKRIETKLAMEEETEVTEKPGALRLH